MNANQKNLGEKPSELRNKKTSPTTVRRVRELGPFSEEIFLGNDWMDGKIWLLENTIYTNIHIYRYKSMYIYIYKNFYMHNIHVCRLRLQNSILF